MLKYYLTLHVMYLLTIPSNDGTTSGQWEWFVQGVGERRGCIVCREILSIIKSILCQATLFSFFVLIIITLLIINYFLKEITFDRSYSKKTVAVIADRVCVCIIKLLISPLCYLYFSKSHIPCDISLENSQ